MQSLIEHWNGTNWRVKSSPNVGTVPNNYLLGVAAPSSTTAWAVGDLNNSGNTSTLVDRWNGTAWKHQPSPDVGLSNNELLAASATSPQDAWAVGYWDKGSVQRTLIEHCC